MNSKTYCRLPFKQITVSPTGRMQICCVSEHNFTYKSDKRHINEFKNVDEWFHGNYMNNIRKSMLEGKPLKECAGCYKVEKNGIQSLRQWQNKTYPSDDPTKATLEGLNIKFGNKCNLKCKMCFPYASSELWKEWQELGWNLNDPHKGGSWKYYDSYYYEDYDWPRKKENFDKLKAMAKYCNWLHFTGGEPMINPKFLEYLKFCVDEDLAKNISLEVVTNCTKIHPKFLRLAKNFKHIQLRISIDGLGSTYDYIRYPGNYNIVEKNFMLYHEWFKENKPNDSLAYNFCLSIFNLHDLTNFIEKFSPLCLNESGAITNMWDPSFMLHTMLPKDYLEKEIQKLIQLDQNTNNILTKQTIWNILQELKKSDDVDNNERWKLLNEFVIKQDQLRKIHIKNYIPHLAKFFNY